MPRPDFLKPLNFFFFAILAASGYLVSAGSIKVTTVLVKIFLSMLFLTLSANIFNEFYIKKIYNIIKVFYSKSKRNDLNRSAIASIILFASGLVVSNSISFYTSVLYILVALLLWIYIYHAKSVRFIRSIFISTAASTAVILGSNAHGFSDAAYMMAIVLFFSNMAGDMVKSITEEIKDRTIFLVNFLKHFSSYIRFDENRTRKTAAVLLAVFIILSPAPYAMGLMAMPYLVIITISSLIAFAALFNLLRDGRNAASLSRIDELIKINMLITIMAFLAGSVL